MLWSNPQYITLHSRHDFSSKSIQIRQWGGKVTHMKSSCDQFQRTVPWGLTQSLTCLGLGQLLLYILHVLPEGSGALKVLSLISSDRDTPFNWLRIWAVTRAWGKKPKACQKKLTYPQALKGFPQNLWVTGHELAPWSSGTWEEQRKVGGSWGGHWAPVARDRIAPPAVTQFMLITNAKSTCELSVYTSWTVPLGASLLTGAFLWPWIRAFWHVSRISSWLC